MEEIAITVSERELTGKKVKRLRRQGLVPAVLYGRRTAAMSLTVPKRQLEQVIAKAGGTRLITVYIGDAATPRNVLLRSIQRDSLSGALLHVDLYEVSMTDKITAEIPIILVGKAPAVDKGMGVLVHGLDSVQVQCLPGDLVPEIAVDISGLTEVHKSVAVGDLKLGEGLTLLTNPEEMIATIAPMGREEVEEVVEEAVEPTLVKKEKVAEEEEEEE